MVRSVASRFRGGFNGRFFGALGKEMIVIGKVVVAQRLLLLLKWVAKWGNSHRSVSSKTF